MVKAKITLSPIHEAVLQAWECAFEGMPIAYLSGPITTGKRYVELMQSIGVNPAAKRQLIKQNCDDLKAMALILRSKRGNVVLEPASLEVQDWSQKDYLALWERLIEKHVNVILFMPDWEYSVGSVTEFVKATEVGVRTETVAGAALTLENALSLMVEAHKFLLSGPKSQEASLMAIISGIGKNIKLLKEHLEPKTSTNSEKILRKDESLDILAEKMNVAQFVSFAPVNGEPLEQFSRMSGEHPNRTDRDIRESITLLLQKSLDRSINVRSFEPSSPQSREFIYGLKSVDEAIDAVHRLSRQGLHTIVNETIDVRDGGVSGVQMGNLLEFSPDDTPRCVEKPGTASLPRGFGAEMLSVVYGVPFKLEVQFDSRIEFSLHPMPCGYRNSHILAWEYAGHQLIDTKPEISWPNNFSKLIGDKAYGLLVANLLGLPVPLTTVISRRVAPFSFGRETGLNTNWIRTCPTEQVPGKFTTHQGWLDPFALMTSEDPTETLISSVLSQRGVLQAYSGALIVGNDGQIIIEGKAGEGETFMLGETVPQVLPVEVLNDVQMLYTRAESFLGPVRFEWVHDGAMAWIVQLHVGATRSSDGVISDLPAKFWQAFEVSRGLEALRSVLESLPTDTGIELTQRIGLTSHFADVLRRANVPARMI